MTTVCQSQQQGVIGHWSSLPLTDLDKRETLIKCSVTEVHGDIGPAQQM